MAQLLLLPGSAPHAIASSASHPVAESPQHPEGVPERSTSERAALGLLDFLESVTPRDTHPQVEMAKHINCFVARCVPPLIQGSGPSAGVSRDLRRALTRVQRDDGTTLLHATAKAGNAKLLAALLPLLTDEQKQAAVANKTALHLVDEFSTAEHEECKVLLRGAMPRWQTSQVKSDVLVHVKEATVRIGIYSRQEKRFLNFASGVFVSRQGHILTAAHPFLGPQPNGDIHQNPPPMSVMYGDPLIGWPRFGQGGKELALVANLVIAIGVFDGDEEPSRWRYQAELLTKPELLKRREAEGQLIDLAVLRQPLSHTMLLAVPQPPVWHRASRVPLSVLLPPSLTPALCLVALRLTGTIKMDPPVYRPKSRDPRCAR